MEGDRKAYSEESQNIIRKQRAAIASLQAENEELMKDSKLAGSQQNENKVILIFRILKWSPFENVCTAPVKDYYYLVNSKKVVEISLVYFVILHCLRSNFGCPGCISRVKTRCLGDKSF